MAGTARGLELVVEALKPLIPKLGNRPRRRARSRFIGYCAEKRADLPGNYFVPFV